MFPFTYVEDDKARKAAADFMKEAAALVGKKAPDAIAASKQGYEKVVEALKELDITKKGVDVAETSMKTMSTIGEKVLQRMEALELKA